jgi:hypothetical protein
MRFFRLTWDFIFGVLIIGTAPLVAFLLVSFASSRAVGYPARLNTVVQKIVFAVSIATSIAAPLVALWLVIRWRKRHRVLPASMIRAEVLLGLLAGGAYFIYMMAMWAFASID